MFIAPKAGLIVNEISRSLVWRLNPRATENIMCINNGRSPP